MNEKKLFSDNLEGIFDMEEGTTESLMQPVVRIEETDTKVTLIDTDTGEITEYDKREGKTDAIDDIKIDVIYDTAMEAFQQQSEMAQSVEPKFSARNAEVAAQYLNIALSAMGVKTHNKRERFKLKMKGANTTANGDIITNNNLIVTDRNEILKALMASQPKDVTPSE